METTRPVRPAPHIPRQPRPVLREETSPGGDGPDLDAAPAADESSSLRGLARQTCEAMYDRH